jgi:hypothetical protein
VLQRGQHTRVERALRGAHVTARGYADLAGEPVRGAAHLARLGVRGRVDAQARLDDRGDRRRGVLALRQEDDQQPNGQHRRHRLEQLGRADHRWANHGLPTRCSANRLHLRGGREPGRHSTLGPKSVDIAARNRIGMGLPHLTHPAPVSNNCNPRGAVG